MVPVATDSRVPVLSAVDMVAKVTITEAVVDEAAVVVTVVATAVEIVAETATTEEVVTKPAATAVAAATRVVITKEGVRVR